MNKLIDFSNKYIQKASSDKTTKKMSRNAISNHLERIKAKYKDARIELKEAEIEKERLEKEYNLRKARLEAEFNGQLNKADQKLLSKKNKYNEIKEEVLDFDSYLRLLDLSGANYVMVHSNGDVGYISGGKEYHVEIKNNEVSTIPISEWKKQQKSEYKYSEDYSDEELQTLKPYLFDGEEDEELGDYYQLKEKEE